MNDTWYSTGFKGYAKAREDKARENGPGRFFIPKPKPGEFNSKNIVMLSDDPFGFWEHGFKLDGSWVGNNEVCLAGIDAPCPLDVGKGSSLPISKYYVGLFTVLDMSEWKTKDGKVMKFQKRVLPAKDKLGGKIKLKKEQRTSLIGLEFTMTRDSGDQTPSTGDDMEFVREWKMDELLAKCKEHFVSQGAKQEFVDRFNLEPFDFSRLIRPRSRKEMANILESIKRGGSGSGESDSGGGSGAEADEEVPF